MLDLRRPMRAGSQPAGPRFRAPCAAASTPVGAFRRRCGHAVGHNPCHIEVAWLWRLCHTREKIKRSFGTVLELMDQYPEYIFMSSQAQLYAYLKEDLPELYERLQERVRQGRWEVEGAMWLEADCNVTSGESLVRQAASRHPLLEKELACAGTLWCRMSLCIAGAAQLLKKSGV